MISFETLRRRRISLSFTAPVPQINVCAHLLIGNMVAYRRRKGNKVAYVTTPSPEHRDSAAPTLFGDLLALSRRSWIHQMADGLARRGYHDYRRSDAAVFRRLLRGPTAVGRLDEVLGASRQAARKIVEGLEQRRYVTTERDPDDARRLIVSLTPAGEAYARAVVDVIESLNRGLVGRVEPEDLAATRRVLLAVISGES
jgi:DNA-binding MarR family transcriptional regulator